MLRLFRIVAAGLLLIAAWPAVRAVGDQGGSASGEVTRDATDTVTFWRTARCCGLNCLYVMLGVHGHQVSYSKLEEILDIGPRGSNLLDLRKAATRFGIRTEVVRAAPRDLERIRLPAIAHLERTAQGDEGHFVLVVEYRSKAITILDGTTALRRELSMDEFRRMWSGHLLTIRDNRSPWARPLLASLGLGVVALIGSWARGRPA